MDNKYNIKLEKLRNEFKDDGFYVLDHFMDVKKSGRRVTRLKLKCKIDDYVWEIDYSKLKTRRYCQKCRKLSYINSRITPKKGESLYEVRPDLVKYFKYESDSKKYRLNSKYKVPMICPNCGHEKYVKIARLNYHYGFSCPICSDGISIPEKFCSNLLNQLNIKFENQKTFEWSNRKIYDFYIKDLDMIIETHGIQHYKDKAFNGQGDLKYETYNDNFKKNLAINNGIKKYLEIDCRKSELEYLKRNFIKNMSNIIDMSKVDFDEVWKNSQNSLVIEVSNYWNNKKNNETLTSVSKKFNLSMQTVIRYLKTGNSLGLCEYYPRRGIKKLP